MIEQPWSNCYLTDPVEYECLADIPGWFNFRTIYQQAAREVPDGGHMVEVGCWLGRSICYLGLECRRLDKRVRIDAVDSWTGDGMTMRCDLIERIGGSDALYTEFLANVARCGLKDVIRPVRIRSPEAAEGYALGSLDFVYIDGDHSAAAVAADLAAWTPRVRPGGMIAGHDYCPDERRFTGLVAAVDAFFADQDLTFDLSASTWKHRCPI